VQQAESTTTTAGDVLNLDDRILLVEDMNEVWVDVTDLDDIDADSISQEIYRTYEVDSVYHDFDHEERREYRRFRLVIGSLDD
jgi:hypothetical protein